MTPLLASTFMRLDFAPILASVLAAVVCAMLGNYLVLRRQSLMGSAISHAVLPGLVIGFILANSTAQGPMFLGAAAAGLVTALAAEIIKRLAKVESGAALGVVFSVMFALGVLLIEQANVEEVDLNAGCVLHGQIEHVIWWEAPDDLTGLTDASAWRSMPQQVKTLLIIALITIAALTFLFKELRIAAFDHQLAKTQGTRPALLDMMLLTLTAIATVAAFEVVGSILVIALLVCPAVIARLLTDRLLTQVWLSVLLASSAAIGGYMLAGFAPRAAGLEAFNSAGMIAVVLGAMILVAAFLSPTHGILPRLARRTKIFRKIELFDLLMDLRSGQPPAPSRVTNLARRLDLTTNEGSLTQRGERLADRLLKRRQRQSAWFVAKAD